MVRPAHRQRLVRVSLEALSAGSDGWNHCRTSTFLHAYGLGARALARSGDDSSHDITRAHREGARLRSIMRRNLHGCACVRLCLTITKTLRTTRHMPHTHRHAAKVMGYDHYGLHASTLAVVPRHARRGFPIPDPSAPVQIQQLYLHFGETRTTKNKQHTRIYKQAPPRTRDTNLYPRR